MELAQQNPDINYIGIERYSSVLLRGLQKRAQLELNNIYFMCIDAKNMADYFAPGEVDKIYLNFSDPWPKDRHAKRRLTSPDFMAVYDQVLAADGTVEFKTDNKGLLITPWKQSLKPAGPLPPTPSICTTIRSCVPEM